jgi:hypothetical protein
MSSIEEGEVSSCREEFTESEKEIREDGDGSDYEGPFGFVEGRHALTKQNLYGYIELSVSLLR